MFMCFNSFYSTYNFLRFPDSNYFLFADNSYYSSMNCDFGISLIVKKKEYGIFLCLLIRAFVTPRHFGFANEISYLLPAISAFDSTNNAT